jgi:hypothetical protein
MFAVQTGNWADFDSNWLRVLNELCPKVMCIHFSEVWTGRSEASGKEQMLRTQLSAPNKGQKDLAQNNPQGKCLCLIDI